MIYFYTLSTLNFYVLVIFKSALVYERAVKNSYIITILNKE